MKSSSMMELPMKTGLMRGEREEDQKNLDKGIFLFIYAHAARHGQPSRLGRNDTRHSHLHSVGHLARSSQDDVGPPQTMA
jgi:hypothetical protein